MRLVSVFITLLGAQVVWAQLNPGAGPEIAKNPVPFGKYYADVVTQYDTPTRYVLDSGERYIQVSRIGTPAVERFYFADPDPTEQTNIKFAPNIVDQHGNDPNRRIPEVIAKTINESGCLLGEPQGKICKFVKLEPVIGSGGEAIPNQYEHTEIGFVLYPDGQRTAISALKKIVEYPPADTIETQGGLTNGQPRVVRVVWDSKAESIDNLERIETKPADGGRVQTAGGAGGLEKG